jgi:hypothetical protein
VRGVRQIAKGLVPRLKGLGFFCVCFWLLTGCASHHYFIVEPAEFAQQIPSQPLELTRGPLRYQFSERHHRLSMAVSNPGTNTLSVVEKKSYIVSPDGQTHLVRGGNIAPKSFMAMSLPPEYPVVHTGPTYGFGMGYGYGWYPHTPWSGVNEPFYSPQSYYIYDEPHRYWEWRKGLVRMRLSFEEQGPGGASFEQDWVFERRRIK